MIEVAGLERVVGVSIATSLPALSAAGSEMTSVAGRLKGLHRRTERTTGTEELEIGYAVRNGS